MGARWRATNLLKGLSLRISGLPEAGLLGRRPRLHLENGEDANQITKLLITRGVDPNTRALLDLLEISSPEKLPTPLQDAVNNGKRARMDLFQVCLKLVFWEGDFVST